MKTTSLELSKKLAKYVKETEWWVVRYNNIQTFRKAMKKHIKGEYEKFPASTTEELLELLPHEIYKNNSSYSLFITKDYNGNYEVFYEDCMFDDVLESFTDKSLPEALGLMLLHLKEGEPGETKEVWSVKRLAQALNKETGIVKVKGE